MTRIAQSKLIGVLVATALFCAAMPQAQATPMDKLIGKSLAVGNLIFSNFAAPSFVGAGPSAIDVQGIVVTDPVTGKQQTGLRFVAPFLVSPKAGPHEIVLNVQYSVTDTAGQLNTIAQSMNATAAGNAAVYFTTQAIPAWDPFGFEFAAGPTLTVDIACITSGTFGGCGNNPALGPQVVVANNTTEPVSAPLFAGTTTFFVEHDVDLLISNRKGVPGGTTALQEFNVLYSE